MYEDLIRFYLGLKRIISKSSYQLNKVKASFLENELDKNGFELKKQLFQQIWFFKQSTKPMIVKKKRLLRNRLKKLKMK